MNTGENVVLVCGPGLPESVTELNRLRRIYPDAVILDGEAATTGAVLRSFSIRMVGAYKRAVDRIVEISLPPDVSADFIADLRHRMEKRRGT